MKNERSPLEKWAEKVVEESACYAARKGSILLVEGIILYSSEEWLKIMTEKGSSMGLAPEVKFIVDIEKERFAIECVDVSEIINCLEMIYSGFLESEGYTGGKVIPFKTTTVDGG